MPTSSGIDSVTPTMLYHSPVNLRTPECLPVSMYVDVSLNCLRKYDTFLPFLLFVYSFLPSFPSSFALQPRSSSSPSSVYASPRNIILPVPTTTALAEVPSRQKERVKRLEAVKQTCSVKRLTAPHQLSSG